MPPTLARHPRKHATYATHASTSPTLTRHPRHPSKHATQASTIARHFSNSKFTSSNKNKKLQYKDEFLLVLMRLRLGLLDEDLADRFCISPTHCSNIFKTSIILLSKTVGKLVAWLPKEFVMETMPKIFKTASHVKLRCITDRSEVFIERPKI